MRNEKRVLLLVLAAQMIIFSILVIDFIRHPEQLNADVTFYNEPFIAEVTAYNNPSGHKTSSGKDTIDGITIAGKPEWEGCVIALYYIDEDGSIGDFYGYREVTDTGYGHASKLYPGKGTIETGETVDIFMGSYEDAIAFGSKKMYIQVIPGKG